MGTVACCPATHEQPDQGCGGQAIHTTSISTHLHSQGWYCLNKLWAVEVQSLPPVEVTTKTGHHLAQRTAPQTWVEKLDYSHTNGIVFRDLCATERLDPWACCARWAIPGAQNPGKSECKRSTGSTPQFLDAALSVHCEACMQIKRFIVATGLLLSVGWMLKGLGSRAPMGMASVDYEIFGRVGGAMNPWGVMMPG